MRGFKSESVSRMPEKLYSLCLVHLHASLLVYINGPMLSSVSAETPGHCTPLHQCLRDRALPQSDSHKHEVQPHSKRPRKLKKSALGKGQIIKGLHVLIVFYSFEVRSSKSGPPVLVLRDHEEHSLLLPFQSLRKHCRKCWPPSTLATEKHDGHNTKFFVTNSSPVLFLGGFARFTKCLTLLVQIS